jgi:3-methylcrotonyl-CoA carboxylase alpha subunit
MARKSKPLFTKILIANRGEIACRVMRTAQRLGIHCIAVYSDADSNALHVKLADQAYRIGPAASRDSYLNGAAIIQIALTAGAKAIHPGYGFLSENAGFAEQCTMAGIIFIGPTSQVIDAMGSKSNAKQLLANANIPLLPGYQQKAQDPRILQKAAEEIGYPLLLKPSAGGGGKGMRIVWQAAEFLDTLQATRREALASFNNDQVILEKYLINPRHIEVQIFADKYGNCIHLFERDCSIQRRYQKVIEEAPAINIDKTLREKILQAAIDVAKTIHYQGAGTVEFLLDNNQQFYFMEMNTRLQVEHPVTEAITGIAFNPNPNKSTWPCH